MILEAARLDVRAGETVPFEAAFRRASSIISAIPGYVSHELHRCLETEGPYLLLVQWERLEDHTVGFRRSAAYQAVAGLVAPLLRSLSHCRALRTGRSAELTRGPVASASVHRPGRTNFLPGDSALGSLVALLHFG